MNTSEIIKNSLILFVITLLSGLVLGFTYSVTKDPIAEQQRLKKETALNNVLSNATFEEVSVDDDTNYIKAIYKGIDDTKTLKGYAFEMITTEGYGDGINLIVGISIDGTVSGIDIVKHTETPGLGAKADEDPFKNQFVGKDLLPLQVVKGEPGAQDIDAIGGATITSTAVTQCVNEAIDYYNNNLKEDK